MSDGTAGTGVYTYEWTLNGKGAVTTETYEVPADAKSGDKIKVTVTDELGNTAEDTVYVGGFTITKVEPTTATTATTTTGYKYIRAYFSSSLATLTADDIEIRDKDTEQLYSVDTVKLSSDGTYADITLFGSQDEGATSFLIPQTIYTMEIANSQGSDIFEFELPMIDSDVLVTAVDIEKGKLFFGGTTGFEVGDVYDGNLGTLVGRRVNVGVNSDNEIEKLSVKKANVVYGVMKYNDKEDGTELTGAISDKDYFEDQVTKTKYYMTSWASATTTIKASSIRRVVDGTSIGDGTDALADVTYKYTKLVLNSNGTVDCAVVDPEAWDGVIKVADVDGTIVSETTKVNVDFDSYTIEKAGEYVTTADLEEDDIVFYDSTGDQKFAEVYNAVVEGEPSDIDSTSIAIDDEAYKWTYKDIITETTVSANYYNTDDDVYEPLLDLGDDVKAQKYLNSLDAEIGVTAYLDRLGNIAYIDGIPSESAVTTDTWYVTTSAGAGYTQALTSYLKFKVSDGTEKTIEIPVDQIKKFNGEKVAISGGTNTSPAADGSDYEFNVDFDDDDPTDYTDVEAQNLIESGVLVKLTTDEDGKIIGITFGGDYSNAETDDYEVVDTIDGKDSNALKPGASKVTTDGGFSAKLTDDTIIWVYTTDQTDSNKITVTKETFADYTRKTDKISVLNAVQADPFDDAAIVGPYVLISGSSVTDVLLRETLDNKDAVKTSNTFVEGDTNSTEGIITAYTTKVNAAGDANYVNTVTVLGLDGTKTTYTALKEGALDDVVGKDVYVSLDLDKTTGNAANVTEYGWTRTSGVDAATSSATEIKTLDGYTVKIDSDAQVLKKTDSGYGRHRRRT